MAPVVGHQRRLDIFWRWEPGMALQKHKHMQVLVWVKLRHLPVEFWTDDGLSMVASGIGQPLYPDAITKACTRLDFACVCIMLDISSKLKHLVILAPTEEGGEVPFHVDIEYEWLPPKCTGCHSLGHRTSDCPSTIKTTKQPVSAGSPGMVTRTDAKGKEIVVYNQFDALFLDDDCAERLHFIGLLETRASPINYVRIQTRVLSRWNWFSDSSGLGNRIWIAWDSKFIVVDVLNLGTQFVHCRVFIRQLHEHVLVAYGANDTISRRDLWHSLESLSEQIDSPWLVCGDFNVVLDDSEICGNAGTQDRLWRSFGVVS
ncbi:UNVERIFIED_CONTAM: hypothetical protein Slati_0892400 [Sesamum latifolium]|uniref:Endonuclease/exonuclease/phosphatase domain-containing protein n=1 Tax=Sesamum latifolium TaxID=2727402 RepID=A0AAW2XN29_9LAMI